VNKPQLDVQDVTLAQVGAGFRSGKGVLWGLVMAAACALMAMWLWLSHNDQARVYGELGRKLNGMRQAEFDAFWQCVLEDVDISSLRSNADLLRWLRSSVESGGPEYALHLRDDCMGMLGAISPRLNQLIAPSDLQADIATMQSASALLQRDFRSVIACVGRGLDVCPPGATQTQLQSIARGWFDFQTAHAAVNRTIRSRLEKP
jgi:hypothetical protein